MFLLRNPTPTHRGRSEQRKRDCDPVPRRLQLDVLPKRVEHHPPLKRHQRNQQRQPKRDLPEESCSAGPPWKQPPGALRQQAEVEQGERGEEGCGIEMEGVGRDDPVGPDVQTHG